MKAFLRRKSLRIVQTYSTATAKPVADLSLLESPSITENLNFVNGSRVSCLGKSSFDLYEPATGAVLRSVQKSCKEDVHEVVLVAKNSFLPWSKTPAFERGQVLKRAADIMRARAEELANVEVLDSGKPIWEARYDVQGCADALEYYGGIAATIRGDFTQLSNGSFAYTVRQPFGVVGAIGAWNYPLQMASWKSAPALACGNSFVFKPSQFTPLSATLLGEIYQDAGLPRGCYNVIQGEGETGQHLVSHPGVSKVSFTGSVPTGSKIMAECAKDIKPVTLELGGKSPMIVFADADLQNATKGAILANFTNAGQVCSNGTRVFVEEGILEKFIVLLIDKVSKMVVGNPYNDKTTIGATINPQQAQIVLSYIELAQKEGAFIAYGGERINMTEPELAQGIYLKPCVLTNCDDNMRVVKEEVFGPVMSVLPFKSEEEAIKRANNSPFGLAGGVFTKDLQKAHRVAQRLEAGSLYVNNYNVYPVGVPFGGYKRSGIGRENGPEALDYYSQVKSVYVEGGDVDCPF